MRIAEFGILKARLGFFLLDALPGADRAQTKVYELEQIAWIPDGINPHPLGPTVRLAP